MDPQVSGFGQKLKHNRFASTLVILATLTLGILIGTVVSAGVKGKEKNSSADATPLQVPSPVQMSNQFSQIARQMEPSVVNINTESTIKNPHGRRMMPPGASKDRTKARGVAATRTIPSRTSLIASSVGSPDRAARVVRTAWATCVSARSVPASSSIPRATS